MLLEYIKAAMQQACYEILKEDGSYYGEIPSFRGVYANAATMEECRDALAEVLKGWILIRVQKNLEIPEINGYKIDHSLNDKNDDLFYQSKQFLKDIENALSEKPEKTFKDVFGKEI